MRKRTHKRQQVQSAVIAALVDGKPVTEAAAAGGVHPATVYRWLGVSDFRRALRKAKGEPEPGPAPVRRYSQDPLRDHPDVQPAREAYLAAAREHHGDVPVERHSGAPDPRWWLQMRDTAKLHPLVEEARIRYREARDRALAARRQGRD